MRRFAQADHRHLVEGMQVLQVGVGDGAVAEIDLQGVVLRGDPANDRAEFLDALHRLVGVRSGLVRRRVLGLGMNRTGNRGKEDESKNLTYHGIESEDHRNNSRIG